MSFKSMILTCYASQLLLHTPFLLIPTIFRDPKPRNKIEIRRENVIYLRNRKHFPCFYRVIETRVLV